nr:hypothetical protein [Tanacetum cinerariifolium]
MKRYLDTLEHLGFHMPNELDVSLILNSLNKDYDQFVQNYKMHNMGKTMVELHAMLKLHEKGIPKKATTPDVLAIIGDVEDHELRDLNEPPNYKDALLDLEYDKWLDAMNAEMQSIKDNQVWCLVDLPLNGQTVRNYEETFSSVTDIRAIRILLAIVAFYDYEIWQIDVKIVFLNGYVREDVYMVQPKWFVDPKHPSKVCKLQQSIYRLKQASRSWNKRFDKEINEVGFTQNPDEPFVYLKASRSNVAFLVLYVDDILIMGNNITMLQDVKSWLCKCFSMKDVGEASYILGIKITRDRSKWLRLDDVLSWLLVRGYLKDISVVRNIIALLKLATGSSVGKKVVAGKHEVVHMMIVECVVVE